MANAGTGLIEIITELVDKRVSYRIIDGMKIENTNAIPYGKTFTEHLWEN